MHIGIGSDHAGFAYKKEIIAFLEEAGHTMHDVGCFDESSVDYADFGFPVALGVASGEYERGILICYTGIGMSMAANKVKGVRCSLCSEPLSARLTREHNDANVLALGAGMIGMALAQEIIDVWLATGFEGGRHKQRIDIIKHYEDTH